MTGYPHYFPRLSREVFVRYFLINFLQTAIYLTALSYYNALHLILKLFMCYELNVNIRP